MDAIVDVLIPTYRRPAALAATLTALMAQTFQPFRVVVSDQSENERRDCGEVTAAARVLAATGRNVEIVRHVPRRGMAEQRDFLLGMATAPFVLSLDDDVILEPWVLRTLVETMHHEQCGFVGCGLIGLSYAEDVRPHEQDFELWDGPVRPEKVEPGSSAWQRYRLHNAANLLHVQRELGATPERPLTYRVAWVGGCVLYDAAKLREVGGYGFWRELPQHHAGEDVVAQLRVMERFGGCGVLPSGAYHQELPTTLDQRHIDAPLVLAPAQDRATEVDGIGLAR